MYSRPYSSFGLIQIFIIFNLKPTASSTSFNNTNGIRIELSSSSRPPGHPADLRFLIINELEEPKDIRLSLGGSEWLEDGKIENNAFSIPPKSWAEVPVILKGNHSEPRNLTILALVNNDYVVSKSVPFQPYRISRSHSPAYCYNQTVTGNCSRPTSQCAKEGWVAQATILGDFEITSIPPALFVPDARTLAAISPPARPGSRQARVRAAVTVNCCVKFVQIVSGNSETNPLSSTCIVARTVGNPNLE